jgi:hypothetical protein
VPRQSRDGAWIELPHPGGAQRSRTNTGDFDPEQQIMITSLPDLSSSLR